MFDQQVTFLYTKDLDQSANFYGNVLKLPLVLDQGSCRIYQSHPTGFIGICTCSEQRPVSPDGMIITFVSDDVNGWYDKLVARGVTFEKPPEENPAFNIYHCFLRDPDGYLLEIQQFKDPAWPTKG